MMVVLMVGLKASKYISHEMNREIVNLRNENCWSDNQVDT